MPPTYRELRARAYPPVRDQLDAIYKLAQAMRDAGTPLPPEVEQWIDACQAVKQKYPKPIDGGS